MSTGKARRHSWSSFSGSLLEGRNQRLLDSGIASGQPGLSFSVSLLEDRKQRLSGSGIALGQPQAQLQCLPPRRPLAEALGLRYSTKTLLESLPSFSDSLLEDRRRNKRSRYKTSRTSFCSRLPLHDLARMSCCFKY